MQDIWEEKVEEGFISISFKQSAVQQTFREAINIQPDRGL